MMKTFLMLFPVIAVLLLFSVSAHAVFIESGIPGGGPDLKGLPPGDTTTTLTPGTKIVTPSQYIRYVYLFVMGFVGIAGLVTLIIWGTVWTASGVVDKKAAAMEGIKNTLYGIGVALLAYVLLYTINPDLTVIKSPDMKIDATVSNTDCVTNAQLFAIQNKTGQSSINQSCGGTYGTCPQGYSCVGYTTDWLTGKETAGTCNSDAQMQAMTLNSGGCSAYSNDEIGCKKSVVCQWKYIGGSNSCVTKPMCP